MLRFSRPLQVAAVAVIALCASAGHGEDRKAPDKKAPPPDQVAAVMQRKLKHAQAVLEGIAVNDFDKVIDNANGLIKASQDAGWMVLRTPRYELYSNEFRRSAEEMIKHAKKKNVDGAALAYVDLTLTCVKCHQHVREERMARSDRPAERFAD